MSQTAFWIRRKIESISNWKVREFPSWKRNSRLWYLDFKYNIFWSILEKIIGGYSKFWFTKTYYNLIIAMSFDVPVSLSNFINEQKHRSARRSLFPPWYAHFCQNKTKEIKILNILIFSVGKIIFIHRKFRFEIIVKNGPRRHQRT